MSSIVHFSIIREGPAHIYVFLPNCFMLTLHVELFSLCTGRILILWEDCIGYRKSISNFKELEHPLLFPKCCFAVKKKYERKKKRHFLSRSQVFLVRTLHYSIYTSHFSYSVSLSILALMHYNAAVL